MEYKVKNGYVLVEPVNADTYELDGSFRAGKIVVGPDVDLGIIIFFTDCELFNSGLLIVKSEDVLVWVKPEAPVVSDEQQNS